MPQKPVLFISAKNIKGTYDVIDCQVYTAHLESLGARMIDKLDYLNF